MAADSRRFGVFFSGKGTLIGSTFSFSKRPPIRN